VVVQPAVCLTARAALLLLLVPMQDGGVVTIFERDDKEFYRRARAFTIEGNPCRVL
jgi:hypothetical protein